MTRPRKQTVDWFPHSVRHGKTMFSLEHKFGNDGYAFWFKLLELLGDAEGHFIDFKDQSSWVFLQAKTLMDDSSCTMILNLLADIDAIDKELWENKVVWSANFVKGIAPLYRNREHKTPVRPDNLRKITGSDGVSDVNNPPREGKGREVEGKDKKKKPIVNPDGLTPSRLGEIWNEKAPPECKRVALPFKRKPKDLDKIKDALKRNPEPQWWERVILLLHSLPFVRGHNKRGWKITIDVLCRDAELILDGKYEGTYGKGPEGGGRPAPPRDPKYEGLG